MPLQKNRTHREIAAPGLGARPGASAPARPGEPAAVAGIAPMPQMAQLTLDEEGLDTLFGTQDENLRRIERTFDVTVAARGNELQILGEPERVAVVERLLNDLSAVSLRGYRFRPGDVQTAIRVLSEDPETSLVEFFLPEGLLASVRRLSTPRSIKQQLYLKAMAEVDLTITIGPAGTGKTYLAVALSPPPLFDTHGPPIRPPPPPPRPAP